ncbi:nitrous oxide reductase accessory protein NosL [Ramlibacter sp.]|uniref:nitrous oxide reductase accessory protein NosL n=1 Tax=Ramlibacter sp. TaxID=1917967 RepID=UPI002D2C301A|nr:nitrous oxide reductase accessory protein NosL [Ramlibacter sp.]HYD78128.1 nitrous oxide reductase accessory protein NosL [Ramlibacter sp.]
MKRRHLLLAACAAPAATLLACSPDTGGSAAAAAPVEIDPATTCDLDGMLLADYPGPKAQIHYAGVAAPVFFCDTTELFAQLLRPEQVRPVRAAYVQDMAKADWNKPMGHWIEARSGFYVAGSKRHGSMGPTFASFATREAADGFAKAFGGRVYAFAEVTPEMADLRGGAQHDQRM